MDNRPIKPTVTALGSPGLKLYKAEYKWLRLFIATLYSFQKQRYSVPGIGGFNIPNKIQSQEHSKDGGLYGEQYLMTRLPNGNRLNLGNFDEPGLNCDNWNWDGSRHSHLGCFALMMCKNHKEMEFTPSL